MVIYTITIGIGGNMKSSKQKAIKSPEKAPFYDARVPDVITIDECKKYLGKFNLDDSKLLEIKNYLQGIIDKSINSYLEEFR